jgi:hypothetical protein
MNLKNGKVFTSKFVGTGPSSYKRRIYRTAVSQRLRNTILLYMKILMFALVSSKLSIYAANAVAV